MAEGLLQGPAPEEPGIGPLLREEDEGQTPEGGEGPVEVLPADVAQGEEDAAQAFPASPL